MPVKPLVLYGHGGVDHILGYLAVVHPLPVDIAFERDELLPVSVLVLIEDFARQVQLIVGQGDAHVAGEAGLDVDREYAGEQQSGGHAYEEYRQQRLKDRANHAYGGAGGPLRGPDRPVVLFGFHWRQPPPCRLILILLVYHIMSNNSIRFVNFSFPDYFSEKVE